MIETIMSVNISKINLHSKESFWILSFRISKYFDLKKKSSLVIFEKKEAWEIAIALADLEDNNLFQFIAYYLVDVENISQDFWTILPISFYHTFVRYRKEDLLLSCLKLEKELWKSEFIILVTRWFSYALIEDNLHLAINIYTSYRILIDSNGEHALNEILSILSMNYNECKISENKWMIQYFEEKLFFVENFQNDFSYPQAKFFLEFIENTLILENNIDIQRSWYMYCTNPLKILILILVICDNLNK